MSTIQSSLRRVSRQAELDSAEMRGIVVDEATIVSVSCFVKMGQLSWSQIRQAVASELEL